MSERHQILSSAMCGCFHCLETFSPDEIEEWVDEDEVSGLGQTAICPRCGIDSVIGFPHAYSPNDIRGHLARRREEAFG